MTNQTLNTAFDSFSEQLHSYLYRLTANRDDAQDLLHDTYLKAVENIQSFKGNSSLKTWVFRIATNLAKDQQRVKKRWALEVQDQCKASAVENQEVRNRILSAFHQQPEKQYELVEHINYCFTCIAKNLELEKQIAIILKEIYEFKRTEIAQILDKTEGVVKHLLYEARKELQEKYHHRCAIINKQGVCYQCAELNDYLESQKSSAAKLAGLGMSPEKKTAENLELRFQAIQKINPLNSKGADLQDTILQILREAIKD